MAYLRIFALPHPSEGKIVLVIVKPFLVDLAPSSTPTDSVPCFSDDAFHLRLGESRVLFYHALLAGVDVLDMAPSDRPPSLGSGS